MNRILYKGIIKYAKDSPDGETAELVIATEEMNGYAVWHLSHDHGSHLGPDKWFPGRDAAIEYAVDKASKLRTE